MSHIMQLPSKHCDMHSLNMRLPSNTGTFGDVKNIIQEISVLWLSTQDQLRNTTLYWERTDQSRFSILFNLIIKDDDVTRWPADTRWCDQMTSWYKMMWPDDQPIQDDVTRWPADTRWCDQRTQLHWFTHLLWIHVELLPPDRHLLRLRVVPETAAR